MVSCLGEDKIFSGDTELCQFFNRTELKDTFQIKLFLRLFFYWIFYWVKGLLQKQWCCAVSDQRKRWVFHVIVTLLLLICLSNSAIYSFSKKVFRGTVFSSLLLTAGYSADMLYYLLSLFEWSLFSLSLFSFFCFSCFWSGLSFILRYPHFCLFMA